MQDSRPESALQLNMYRQMLTIRRFEERCNYLFMQGKIPSTLHLYIGQEAVAVGRVRAPERQRLRHQHAPAARPRHRQGRSLRSIMAELFAKRTGCCKGKGGSMHVGDMSVGMIPAIAIVGGNIPLATGAGAGVQAAGRRAAWPSAFLGDGATNEGAFHEGAQHGRHLGPARAVRLREQPLRRLDPGRRDVQDPEYRGPRCGATACPARSWTAWMCWPCYEAAGRAIDRARAGGGPTLLECKTYRLCGHSRSDPRTYRTKEEEAGVGRPRSASSAWRPI